MGYTVDASVYTGLPGAVRVAVIGTDVAVGTASTSRVVRLDPATPEPHPVRNFNGLPESGLLVVVDCEAPLGRPVQYQLLSWKGDVLATSGWVTAPAPGNGMAVLRSPLRPSVAWMYVEPQDETGVTWETSTTVHRVVGSDTPVVVSEVRQRRTGTMTFLCKSIPEANELVSLCGDGRLLLLRMPPCASEQARDLLFYPLTIEERRWGRKGWRLVAVDYQSTKWVGGDTLEPPLGDWTFADLRDSAASFAELPGLFENFGSMSLDIRKGGGV